jgi:very-short-patch-repair endonuclease
MLVNKEQYYKYEDLKNLVKSLEIKSKDDYIAKYKTLISYGLKAPLNPRTFYGIEIWENWSAFLNKPLHKKNHYKIYYSYLDCKNIIQSKRIKSKTDFAKNIKNIIHYDIRIPYNPYIIYKSEWESWGEFLGTGTIQNMLKDWVPFEEARNWARKLDFKMTKEWRYMELSKLPEGIPTHPDRSYKNKGWVDWYDWLGIDKRTKISYGEKKIYDFLTENGIKFNHNKSLLNCSHKSKLRFDFYLHDYNLCIEYDGIQHTKPIDIFGGEKEFEKTKIRDEIKNLFCKLNGIKLIRLSYTLTDDEMFNIIKKSISI